MLEFFPRLLDVAMMTTSWLAFKYYDAMLWILSLISIVDVQEADVKSLVNKTDIFADQTGFPWQVMIIRIFEI